MFGSDGILRKERGGNYSYFLSADMKPAGVSFADEKKGSLVSDKVFLKALSSRILTSLAISSRFPSTPRVYQTYRTNFQRRKKETRW